MGNIEFADCQDARNQKQIMEIECPHCHAPNGIEVFLKDGTTVGESECEACGYVLPEGSSISIH